MSKGRRPKKSLSRVIDLTPRTLALARKGVRNGDDLAALLSALISDNIEGRVTTAMTNSTCNAAGKLMKIVELQHKYGMKVGADGVKSLTIAPFRLEAVAS